MVKVSLPPWAQNLRTYRHECGMLLYMGYHRPGGHDDTAWPVFQVVQGLAVLCCPRCGMRIKLDHCRLVGERTEEELDAQNSYQPM